MGTRLLSTRVSDEVYRRVRIAAAQEGVPLNAIHLQALLEYLERRENLAATKKIIDETVRSMKKDAKETVVE
jgi:hypothetical protein